MWEEAHRGMGAGKRFQEQGGPGGSAEPDARPEAEMQALLADERRRAAWAGAAEAYEVAAEPWTNQAAAVMIGLAGISPRSEVLDLGCGTGGLALAAQTLGALVTAYDIAPSMIAVASGRPGGAAVEFKIGEIRALPDREGAFDVAIANFAILETGEPEVALKEAYRALKPGGRLLWTCWPAPTGGALFEVVDSARLASEGIGGRPPSARGLAPEAAVALTSAAGFGAVESLTIGLSDKVDAAKVLKAAEKLDAATPATSARSQTLAALEEALRGSETLRTEAILLVAEKTSISPSAPTEAAGASALQTPAAATPAADAQSPERSAPPKPPHGVQAREPAQEGGLVGLFRRWLRRR